MIIDSHSLSQFNATITMLEALKADSLIYNYDIYTETKNVISQAENHQYTSAETTIRIRIFRKKENDHGIYFYSEDSPYKLYVLALGIESMLRSEPSEFFWEQDRAILPETKIVSV